MSSPTPRPALSYADFLALDARSDFLLEFFDGEVWAMSGGTAQHAQLIANTTVVLSLALRGRPCRVYSEALRVYLPDRGEGCYPDLKVVCGPTEHDPADPVAVTNPTLLVEVLSDGTETFDRGDKFARYRTLPSLRAFLLVDQHTPRLELFERNDDGTWTYGVAESGQTLVVRSLQVELSADEVYRDVELTPRSRSAAGGVP